MAGPVAVGALGGVVVAIAFFLRGARRAAARVAERAEPCDRGTDGGEPFDVR